MKTLIHLFGQDETKKSFEQFVQLSINSMLMIKGGDGDPQDDDLWPPIPPSKQG